jgi:hypothetical protein
LSNFVFSAAVIVVVVVEFPFMARISDGKNPSNEAKVISVGRRTFPICHLAPKDLPRMTPKISRTSKAKDVKVIVSFLVFFTFGARSLSNANKM